MSKQPTTPPAGWEVKRLKDVADIRFSSVDKKSRPGEKPVRLCNYVDAYKNEYLTGREEFMKATATDAEIAQFGIQTGDIMVTKDSETPDDIAVPSVYVGESGRLVCGYHLALVRPDQDEVNPIFLAKQIRHHRLARYFGRVCNGLTRYGLPTAAFDDAEIWRPDRPKQDAIARVLQTVDDAIRHTGAVIEKLKKLKAGLLLDLLTRGIDEDGQLRDPKRNAELFKDSPLGRVPMAWGVGPFGGHVTDSAFGPRFSAGLYSATGPLALLRTTDLDDEGNLLTVDLPRVNLSVEAVKPHVLLAGDLLITRSGTVGVTTVFRSYRVPVIPGAFTIRFRLKASLLPEYARVYFNWCVGRKRVVDVASGGVQKNVTGTAIRRLLFACPEPAEQSRVLEVLRRHEARARLFEEEYAKLSRVKQGLMQDLLTGVVRVPAAMIDERPEGSADGKVVKLGANIHFKRAVLAAEVVDQMHGDSTFGHVKLMKTLYLVEQLAELELESHYLRAAAGPFDNRLLRSVDAQLKKKQWFDKVPRSGKSNGPAGGKPMGWCYVPLAKQGEHRPWFDKYWGGAKARIQAVIDLLRPLDTQRCEILATLYEAWRALASSGKAASDAAIVDEVLLRWHESKQAIPRERWERALEWMRAKGLLPKASSSNI